MVVNEDLALFTAYCQVKNAFGKVEELNRAIGAAFKMLLIGKSDTFHSQKRSVMEAINARTDIMRKHWLHRRRQRVVE